jgi:transposase-like protein
MAKYRRHAPELKARVALEALQGGKTTAQLSREHDVSPDLINYWTRQLTERAPELFRPTRDGQAEARIAELERLVGQLTVELAAVKKVSNHLTSRSNNGGKP